MIGFTPAAVAVRPDVTLAVHDTTYEVVELPNGQAVGPAPRLDGEPSSAALSSDGTVLAIGYPAGKGVDDPRARIDVFDVACR